MPARKSIPAMAHKADQIILDFVNDPGVVDPKHGIDRKSLVFDVMRDVKVVWTPRVLISRLKVLAEAGLVYEHRFYVGGTVTYYPASSAEAVRARLRAKAVAEATKA